MDEVPQSTQARSEPGTYAIRIRGHLDDRWAATFGALSVARAEDGTTLLCGPVADQAALHGLLRRVRDLGLPLISVAQVEPPTENGPGIDTDTQRRRPYREPNRT
jgi:hypothetical protein